MKPGESTTATALEGDEEEGQKEDALLKEILDVRSNNHANSSSASTRSRVYAVLEDASLSLNNVDTSKIPFNLGGLFNVTRRLVWNPALKMAASLSPVATTFPLGDTVSSLALGAMFDAIRFAYHHLIGGGGSASSSSSSSSSSTWRYMLADRRLAKLAADEIAGRSAAGGEDAIARAFERDRAGDATFAYEDEIRVPTKDPGVTLSAFLMEPATATVKKAKLARCPAIVFVNSWSFTEQEYVVQAARFAKKGYIVLGYCTRGFGKSDGNVDVAGPKDMEDMGCVLDWLEENTKPGTLDKKNIGLSGISYGGGMSLLGAAHHPARIKCAASMSGWADLIASLYADETPRQIWGPLLLISGTCMGTLDPIVPKQLYRIFAHEDVDEVRRWGHARSAQKYVDTINKHNIPIYMSNNFADDLFNGEHILKFFESLTVEHKRLDFNQGIHGTAEGFGCAGMENYTWTNVHKFFDFHLRNDASMADVHDQAMTMEIKSNAKTMKKPSWDGAHFKGVGTGGNRTEFRRWPPPSENARTARYHLHPKGAAHDGALSLDANTIESETTIRSGLIGSLFVNTGIPFLSGLREQLGMGIRTLFGVLPGGINRFKLAVYLSCPAPPSPSSQSPGAANGGSEHGDTPSIALKIRGRSKLNVRIKSSINKAMLVAYVYDINPESGLCCLISHGCKTKHNLIPDEETPVSVDIQPTAYDLPTGHMVGLAIDTHDPLYWPPTRRPYRITLCHHYGDDTQSTLEMNYIE